MRIQLQIAARRRVQRDRLARALHSHAGEMRQRALLGFLDIAEQTASRCRCQRQVVHTEATEIAGAEETIQFASCCIGVVMPRRPFAQAGQRTD